MDIALNQMLFLAIGGNMDSKAYVKSLAKRCEPLYQYSENNVKMFFQKDPDKSELVDYFLPRMMNERMNCTHIAKKVANLPDNTTPDEMFLLSKQVLDEAKHFKLVVEIIEYLMDQQVDVENCISEMKNKAEKSAKEGGGLRPAHILEKYESSGDALLLALYQMIGEGRAARNWDMIGEVAKDPYLASRYKTIAKDEKFHAKLGRLKLEKLCTDEATQKRADDMAQEIIDDLFTLGLAKRYYVDPSLISLNSCPKSYYQYQN